MANDARIRLAIDGTAEVANGIDKVGSNLGTMETRAKAAAAGADTLKTALSAMAGTATIYALVKMADAVTTLNTQLRLSSNTAGEATKAYGALFEIAQKSRVSFTELGTTYAAIARSGKELGVSQDRLLTVTQSISQAMTIGGGSAASMQAALVQLGQGLSSGTLRGEELNSIMEQTPRLAKAIADGLGVPIGELRKLGEAGALTSQQIITALEKSGPQLAKEMASATLTVGQAFTMLTNSATNFIGTADAASGVSGTLAGMLQGVSGGVDSVGAAIKNNEVAFGFIVNGLAGAATAAGLTLTAIGIGAVWAAITLGGSAAVTAGLAALGAVIGLAATAGKEMSKTEGVLKISLAQINNQIETAEKNKNYTLLVGLQERKKLLEDELRDKRQKAIDSNTIGGAQSPDRLLDRASAKEAIKDQAALDALRLKLSKVPESYIKDMGEIIRLNQAGVLVGKEYTDVLAKQQALLLKKPDKGNDSAKAHADQNERMRIGRHLAIQMGEEVEAANNAYAKSMAEATKEREKFTDALAKSADTIGAQVLKLEEEEKASALATSQNITLAQAIELITIARLQEARAVQLSYGDDVAADAIQREIDNRKKLIGLIGGKELREANAKSAKEAAEEGKKAADSINKDITDALMRGFENGKGFAENFRDTVANMFRTLVLRPVISAVVSPISQGITSMMGGMGSTSSMSQSGGWMSGLSSIKGAYDAMQGGFSAAYVNAANTSYGSAMGLSTAPSGVFSGATAGELAYTNAMANGATAAQANTAALQANTANLTTTGTAMGTALSYVGAAAAGISIGSAIAGDKKLMGLTGTETSAIGFAAGAYLGAQSGSVGGPWGAFIGAVVGGVVSAGFGEGPRQYGNTTLSGTFAKGATGGNNFSGQNESRWNQKNGWFVADQSGVTRSELSGGQQSGLNALFNGVESVFSRLTAVTGDATKSLDGWSYSINQAANTAAEQTAITNALAESLGGVLVPELAAFKASGESLADTAVRVRDEFLLTNHMLALTGTTAAQAFGAAGLASTAMRENLLVAFGGMQAATATMQTYFETFFTKDERDARSKASIADSLLAVGVAVMPETLAAYRAVVEGAAKNLGTLEGQATYSTLIKLSSAFAAITPELDAVTTAFVGAAKSIKTLLASIASERSAVTGARDTLHGPQSYTLAQLQSGVAAIAATSGAPSTSAMDAANAAVIAATTRSTAAQAVVDVTKAALGSAKSANDSLVMGYAGLRSDLNKLGANYAPAKTAITFDSAQVLDNQAYAYDAEKNRLKDFSWIGYATLVNTLTTKILGIEVGKASTTYTPDYVGLRNSQGYYDLTTALDAANPKLAVASQNIAAAQTALTAAQTAFAGTAATQAVAVAAAKQASIDYATAVTAYVVEASKSVPALSRLREETVKYYEAQKQLAQGMQASAEGLRTAAVAMRLTQLGAVQSVAQKQADFAQNYSLALSTSGATKGGYADKMAAALPALSDALKETSTLRDWAIATAQLAVQSNTIADQLGTSANGLTYEADSLALLDSIDATLSLLDDSTAAITRAIESSAELTATGLRAVVSALGGTPAFAAGGYHSGGLRMVGENGPELEVTGPSRIFNAAQTRGMFAGGGDTSRMEALLEKVIAENVAIRAELRAITVHSANTSDNTRRMDRNGVMVYTDPGAPISTKVAA